ncbi:DUF1612 domain-containing protein [Rhizobium sp. KAs_5_22]|nr:DUF1612 domain-containing protein [Rhizobium sp. KAs_5_22]
MSAEGSRSLRGERRAEESGLVADQRCGRPFRKLPENAQAEADEEGATPDPLAAELAAIDAVPARSEAVLAEAKRPVRGATPHENPLVYDADWDENERFDAWRSVLRDGRIAAGAAAALVLDAWDRIQVLQHAPWLRRLLAASSRPLPAGLLPVPCETACSVFPRHSPAITPTAGAHHDAQDHQKQRCCSRSSRLPPGFFRNRCLLARHQPSDVYRPALHDRGL